MPPSNTTLKTTLTTGDICKAAGIETDGELAEPSAYLRTLFANQLRPEAVRFLAHSLPPRECIEWAIEAVRCLQLPPSTREREAALQQVQAWLASPVDAQRRTAKERAEAAGLDAPEGVLAMAVFFSGGSITPAENPEVPPPPATCQKLVAGAVTLAVVSHQPERAAERFRSVLALRLPDLAT